MLHNKPDEKQVLKEIEILAVDDNNVNLAVIAKIIEKTIKAKSNHPNVLCKVIRAKSGKEAIVEVQKRVTDNKPFSAIFLDQQMEDMSGDVAMLEFTKNEIVAHFKPSPVIVCSSIVDSQGEQLQELKKSFTSTMDKLAEVVGDDKKNQIKLTFIAKATTENSILAALANVGLIELNDNKYNFDNLINFRTTIKKEEQDLTLITEFGIFASTSVIQPIEPIQPPSITKSGMD